MKGRNKIFIILISPVILILLWTLAAIPIRQNGYLQSLENEVANIALPKNIEKITIKSAIGDSGGNGDYSTFRVVLVVKTELDINELKSTIEDLNLRFPKHYKNSDNNPTQFIYITHCEGGTFHSSRDFELRFTELAEITDYSNFYFIEFVE